MKTNWPDDRLDYEIELGNPLRDDVAAGWERSPQANALFTDLLRSVRTQRGLDEPRRSRNRYVPRFGERGMRSQRLALVGVAAMLVGVFALVTLPNWSRPRLEGGPGALTASAVLRHAALVADDQPELPLLAPTGFVYTDEIDVDLESGGGSVPNVDPSAAPSPVFTVLQKITRQSWFSPDGANRIVEELISRSWLTPEDAQAWEANGSPPLDSEFSLVDGSVPPSTDGAKAFVDPAKLPTDPAQLAEDLGNGTIDEIGLDPGRTTPTVMPAPTIFANVTQILGETNTPPAVRSAIYQVISMLPGVQLLGTVQDSVGRSGIAVALTAYGERQEMIFDADTSQLLESEIVLTDPSLVTHDADKNPQAIASLGVPPGTVIQSATYLARGITNSDLEVPATSSVPATNGASATIPTSTQGVPQTS